MRRGAQDSRRWYAVGAGIGIILGRKSVGMRCDDDGRSMIANSQYGFGKTGTISIEAVGGYSDRGKNPDDGDDDHQFYQRKPLLLLVLHCIQPLCYFVHLLISIRRSQRLSIVLIRSQ